MFKVKGTVSVIFKWPSRIKIFAYEVLEIPLDLEYSRFSRNTNDVICVEFTQYVSVHFHLHSL